MLLMGPVFLVPSVSLLFTLPSQLGGPQRLGCWSSVVFATLSAFTAGRLKCEGLERHSSAFSKRGME